jgi:hypothetical protein
MSNGERKRGLARQQQDALSAWDRVNAEAHEAREAANAAWKARDEAEDRAHDSVQPAPVLIAHAHEHGRRWAYPLVHPDHVRADYRSLVLGDKAWEAEALAAVEAYRAASAAANARERVEELIAAHDEAGDALAAAIDRVLSTPAPDAKSISEKLFWLSHVLPEVRPLSDIAYVGAALASPDDYRETLSFLSVYFDALRLAGEGERVPALLAQAAKAFEAEQEEHDRPHPSSVALQASMFDGWEASAWVSAWEAEGGSFARSPEGRFYYVQPDPVTEKAEGLLSELDTGSSRYSPALARYVQAEAISGELIQLVASADRARLTHSAAVTAADHPPTERESTAEEERAVNDACAAMDHAHAELLNYTPRNPHELAYKAAAVERAWQLLADEDADSYAYLIARDARAAAGQGEGA